MVARKNNSLHPKQAKPLFPVAKAGRFMHPFSPKQRFWMQSPRIKGKILHPENRKWVLSMARFTDGIAQRSILLREPKKEKTFSRQFLVLKRFFTAAQNGTRTHTPLRELGPEPSASTNSAIWAGNSRNIVRSRSSCQSERRRAPPFSVHRTPLLLS